jgi:hypothetical protein
MNRSRLLLVLLGLYSSFACLAQTISWYKSYNGTIDKYPVTMHLHKTGHKYSGYYYYSSRQYPVYFIGEDTTVAGNIRLSAFLPDKETDENFIFSIAGPAANGEWHATGKAKALAFSAKEVLPGLAFDYIYTEDSKPLRATMKESPAGSFDAAAVWPKGNSAQVIFLKKIIAGAFDEKNSTEDIGKIFLRQKKQFFTDYLEEYKDTKEDELKDSYSFSLDQSSQLMIMYRSSKLLTLAQSSYSYTGGAHGNYGTSYISLDLVNNKELRLNDVMTDRGQDHLPELLEKYFRKAYAVKANDPLTEGGLFEDNIAPNDNFYITGKGIGFCYNPYEIGPYAMGEINIFIPFTELNAYLLPAFKKLIL